MVQTPIGNGARICQNAQMKLTRRELVLSLLRLSAAGGLVGGVAVQLARRPSRGNDDSCRSAGSCRDCRRLAACGHPRGLSARQVLGGGA